VFAEDLLVALKVDRVRQLSEQLADELLRVTRSPQDARHFLVRPGGPIGAHARSVRSRRPTVYERSPDRGIGCGMIASPTEAA